MVKKTKPKIVCSECGARLVGLIQKRNGEIVTKPGAKKPTTTYPFCSRCWIKYTPEGSADLRQRQMKHYNTHQRKGCKLEDLQELCKRLGYRLKTDIKHGLWKYEVWKGTKPLHKATSVKEMVKKIREEKGNES